MSDSLSCLMYARTSVMPAKKNKENNMNNKNDNSMNNKNNKKNNNKMNNKNDKKMNNKNDKKMNNKNDKKMNNTISGACGHGHVGTGGGMPRVSGNGTNQRPPPKGRHRPSRQRWSAPPVPPRMCVFASGPLGHKAAAAMGSIYLGPE